jgi:hypothetical protein
MTFSNSQYRFSETPENKPHTQGEGPQMSEKNYKRKGRRDNSTQKKIIQFTSYKPLTLNVDTTIKCDEETMEYDQALE